MRHVLALTDPELISEFQPSLNGRSSLLQPIIGSRGCYELRIEDGLCACDVGLNPHSVQDKHFLHRLYIFAVDQLNGLVRTSSYAELCGHGFLLLKPVVQAHLRVLSKPRNRNSENSSKARNRNSKCSTKTWNQNSKNPPKTRNLKAE